MTRPAPGRQRGAALLIAMLTVTLVATLSARALWQQWRATEVESAERTRVQSTWILNGALDWARLILREDARAGGADHLAEPWALPLQEARLSTFLSMDAGSTETARQAFLSGRISDLQARLNVANLLDGERLSEPGMQAFARLFEQVGLPQEELTRLGQQLLRAHTGGEGAPLQPRRVEQLVWLGLSPATVARLTPFVTLLPDLSPVNINTASAEVIMASVPGLSLADARRMVAERDNAHFQTLLDSRLPAAVTAAAPQGQLAVASRYFEIRGRLRLDTATVEEISVVQRDGLTVRTLWRERARPTGSADAGFHP